MNNTNTIIYKSIKIKKNKFFLTKKELMIINKKNNHSNKLGRAALLHGYEEHKIKKWEKKHPKPSELDLLNDLFPKDLKLAWEAGREIALQHIRNVLIEKYYSIKRKEKIWHDVAIYKNEYTGELYNYFNVDPYLVGNISQTENSIEVYNSLRTKFLNIKKGGNKIIKINLYDNNGNVRFTCAA